MKNLLVKSFVILIPLNFIACNNTIFLGHDHAYDLNVDFGADVTKVVAVNAGFESRSYAAVPPQGSLSIGQLRDSALTGSGDALSTLTTLKVHRVNDGSSTIDFIIATATGEAAEEVANQLGRAGAGNASAETNPIGSSAANITRSGAIEESADPSS